MAATAAAAATATAAATTTATATHLLPVFEPGDDFESLGQTPGAVVGKDFTNPEIDGKARRWGEYIIGQRGRALQQHAPSLRDNSL